MNVVSLVYIIMLGGFTAFSDAEIEWCTASEKNAVDNLTLLVAVHCERCCWRVPSMITRQRRGMS